LLDSIKTTFLEETPYRAVVGLAKDGRPIFNPYYDNGKSYNDCEVDVCNGHWVGDDYFYVSTFFHPWVIGCYGPGNYPELSQSCSGKPRQCVDGVSDISETVISTDNGETSEESSDATSTGTASTLLTTVVTVGLVAAAGYAVYFYIL
jgi:hypothetical protein